MTILLLGEKNSERIRYFKGAANNHGIDLNFVELPNYDAFQSFDVSLLKNCAVKIDPPTPHSAYIEELNIFCLQYLLFLKKLQNVPLAKFLNSPNMIAHTLDKLHCKHILEDVGIRTAPSVTGVNTISELRAVMSEKRLRNVFIKPRFGSGAAGIVALRINPKTSEEVIYTTTVQMSDGRICNTRKQRRICDPNEIEAIVNNILHMGAVVEEWIPKEGVNGKAYDMRMVWQFGKIECAVVRLANGPITNLHLGGHAINLDELHLSKEKLFEIEELCGKAMSLFPGMNSAGIDVLLDRNTRKPYIIEINGQGDFIYKDVKGENRIYQSQIMYLNTL